MAASIDRLWAPWRSVYLSSPRKGGACIFCAARRASSDRKHHVVLRGKEAFVLLNRYPYNNGHVMVAPFRHVGRLERLRPSEWGEMLRLAQRVMARLQATLHPQGFNLGLNLGRVGGAGIPGHLHLHIVPRWTGDTNFMPVIGQTKIISQSLEELWMLLHTPKG